MDKDTLSNLKSPKAIMRPGPFWSWNDKLDEAELRRQIREMAEKGWGSYFHALARGAGDGVSVRGMDGADQRLRGRSGEDRHLRLAL